MNKPRVTIADVAEKANVSKMTVSRVINHKGEISEATRRRILQVMDELDYRPNQIARSLATDMTFRIGILVPALSNPYFGEIIEGSESVFWENDYHIVLGHSGGKAAREQAVMEIFEENRVDGIIVLSGRGSLEVTTENLSHQRAAVVINTRVQAGVAARLYTDEHKTMAMIVSHLIKNGRRHLGYFGIDVDTYATIERARGFELALQNAGLPFDSSLQLCLVPDAEPAVPEVIGEMLKADPQLDGLVCFNSGFAAKALIACAHCGRRVPDDIAVVGYDDNFMAEITTPPLTTADLVMPKHEVGAMAARLLLERIQDGITEQPDVLLEHRLIVRDSAP